MQSQLGSTGQFPQGRLNDDDEGEIAIAITVQNGVVRIDFGKTVAWLGLPPDHADRLADLLKARAAQIRAQLN